MIAYRSLPSLYASCIASSPDTKLIDDFYKSFPKIQQLRLKVEKMAEEYGYVTTIQGRKRNLAKISAHKLITISSSKDLTDAFLMARNVLEVDLSNCITT